jgi:hypothetical protein
MPCSVERGTIPAGAHWDTASHGSGESSFGVRYDLLPTGLG